MPRPMGNCLFLLSKVRHFHSTFVFQCSDVLLRTDDGTWAADIFNGHAIGCNAVSWAPATLPGSLITPNSQPQQQPQQGAGGNEPASYATAKRFASAGCDNLVKIWGYRWVSLI